jgi:uncharacterized protein (UPF0332 family)
MSDNKTALIAKADRALRSARLLLEIDDTDGAGDRAYYAMFDATRAAFLHAGIDLPKTHSGTATVFSQRIVKPELVPGHLGRDLNRVEEVRNLADYTAERLSAETARDAIFKAETFVREIKHYLNTS